LCHTSTFAGVLVCFSPDRRSPPLAGVPPRGRNRNAHNASGFGGPYGTRRRLRSRLHGTDADTRRRHHRVHALGSARRRPGRPRVLPRRVHERLHRRDDHALDRLDALADAGASLYGISIDSPFSLGEFAEQNELNFPLVGDTNKEVIEAYDVVMDFADLGISGVAKRSVFVLDDDGTITYAWVSDDPGVEPDYDELEAAAGDA